VIPGVYSFLGSLIMASNVAKKFSCANDGGHSTQVIDITAIQQLQ